MCMARYQVISLYKYVPLDDPERLQHKLRGICKRFKLLGRMLIGKEGTKIENSRIVDFEKRRHRF